MKVVVYLVSRAGRKAWNSTHTFTHNFLFGSDLNEKPRCPLALSGFEVSVLACTGSRAIHPDSPSLFVCLYLFFFPLSLIIAEKKKETVFPWCSIAVKYARARTPFLENEI